MSGGRWAPEGADLSDGPPSDPARRNTWYDQYRGDAADRRPCPNPGESRHYGKCVQNAEGRPRSSGGGSSRPADRSIAQVMQEIPKAEEVPDPPGFRRRSHADVLLDPRFLQGSADADRQIAGVAEATGVRGAPVMTARTGARQNLANQLYGTAFGEDLQTHGANVGVNQIVAGRAGEDWNRAFRGSTAQLEADDRRFGLETQRDLGIRGLDLTSGLGYARLGEGARQFDAGLDFRREDSAAERAYRYWATRYGHDVALIIAGGGNNPYGGGGGFQW